MKTESSRITIATAILCSLMLSARATTSTPLAETDYYNKVIASSVRTDADRKSDDTRRPVEFLQFTQVQPGERVLDIAAGGGNTSQLLALAVGPEGGLWAQTAKAGPGIEKRLAEHPDSNIKLLVRSFNDPYPADLPRLDLVTLIMNYHDIVNAPFDRAAMNRKIFEALKPGGRYIVIDHSTKPGVGLTQTNTLHRIDEATVIQEVTQAGFILDSGSSYLRNAADPREQNYSEMKTMTSDKFALRFVKR